MIKFDDVKLPLGVLVMSGLFGCSTAEEVIAQEYEEPSIDMEVVEQIKKEGIENSNVMDYAGWLTDVYGPRLTNSEQMRRANHYTKEVFEELGLENVHLHEWGPFGRGWDLDRFAMHAYTEHTYFPVTAFPKAWSPGYDEPVRGEVIYLSPDDEETYREYEGQLGDKFVMVQEPADPQFHFDPLTSRFDDSQLLNLANAGPDRMPEEGTGGTRSQDDSQYRFAKFLQEEEPLAVLDQSYRGKFGQIAISGASLPSDPELGWMDRPRPHQPDAEDPVPQVSLTQDHYGRLFRLIEKGVEVELEMELEARYQTDDLMGYNTVAEIPGTDPEVGDEIVLIGAHLDSWHSGTGATDNAAGSAVMMEVMRILSETGIEPRRTIRIALWDGEEQGLHGSREYVQEFVADQNEDGIVPLEEYEKLSAYYNHDNGTGQIRGINLQENEQLRDYFRTWFQPFHDWDAATVSYRNTGATDHVPFDAVGIPGFQFIQDPIEYFTKTHHSNMDVFERLKKKDLKRNSVMIASIVYHTAQLDHLLPRKNDVELAD